MATSKIQLTQSWVLAADEAEEFLLENPSSYPVLFTFQDSAPATDAACHTLSSGDALMRMSLTGDLYVKRDTDVATFVILSK